MTPAEQKINELIVELQKARILMTKGLNNKVELLPIGDRLKPIDRLRLNVADSYQQIVKELNELKQLL